MSTIKIVGTALLLVLCFENACSQHKNQKPNIVLIVADDHGIDALGCYGNPVICYFQENWSGKERHHYQLTITQR